MGDTVLFFLGRHGAFATSPCEHFLGVVGGILILNRLVSSYFAGSRYLILVRKN